MSIKLCKAEICPCGRYKIRHCMTFWQKYLHTREKSPYKPLACTLYYDTGRSVNFLKTKRISARISSNAFDRLHKLSEYCKLSKSEIVERMILNKRIIVISGFTDFIPALKSAERNLNQVAARLSMGQSVLIDISELKKTYSEILEYLKRIKRGELDGNN